MGKTANEHRDWVRAQLAAYEKSHAKKLRPLTIDTYCRKFAQLDAQRHANGVIPLSAFGEKSSSFYVNRAALCYVSVQRARQALSDMSRADKQYRHAKLTSDSERMAMEKANFQKAWSSLIAAGNDLARNPPGKAGQYVAAQSEYVMQRRSYRNASRAERDLLLDTPTPPAAGAWKTAVENKDITPSDEGKRSKRRVVNRIQKKYPDWRNKAFEKVSPKWRLFTAVTSVTGCRPEEIVDIRFYRDREDPTFLTFEIHGAKTGQGHGISLRTVSVREHHSAAFGHLMSMALTADVTVVWSPTKNSGKRLEDVNAAFRNAINQAGKRFMREWKDAPSLSPYCFRHSFACDIKAGGFSMKSLAIALGHATTKTQRMYGRANDGIKGKRELKVDESGYDVKEPSQSPLIPRRDLGMSLQTPDAEAVQYAVSPVRENDPIDEPVLSPLIR
jgi:integrase